MSACAMCGRPLSGNDASLCPQHVLATQDSWSTGNRIMCDFFHRGIVPGRLSSAERDDLKRHAVEAA
jgi:hypothetical protein